jgi:hypothetical protein
VRSSSFESSADQTIAAMRYSLKPNESSRDLSFRCVVQDPMYFAPSCEQLAVYGKDAIAITGAPEGQTVVNGCPVLSIGQGENCGPNDTPYTVVTFNPPPPTGVINPGACAPTADVNKFVCYTEENVSISASCFVDVVGEPSCSPGYTFDPATNTCKYDATGTDGQCLPGRTFNPANQCCQASEGADASASYPVCPPGTYYDATLLACFDIPVSGMISTSATVGLKSCTGGNQPQCDPAVDPNCQQACPPQPCSPTSGQFWCPSACACRPRGQCP